jgi:uncharacterized damage-inducible protein DinB
MSQTLWIADDVARMTDGDAWHGPSITQNLSGVNAEQAAARPIPQAHSIWEIVAHMTAWANEVADRLNRSARPLMGKEDWPPVANTSPAAWEHATHELRDAHQRLRVAIREFPPGRLDEVVPGTDGGPGAVSYQVMLHGLIQHDAYHTGQIGLLKKAAQSLARAS